MRHQVTGKKLGRNTKQRKALFKSLISSLVLYGRIKTTQAKAKAIKNLAEKLVTKIKKGTLEGQRSVRANLAKIAAEKLIKEIAPRFQNRQGGFLRILKLGQRFGDGAEMVVLEWVEGETKSAQKVEDKKSATTERTEQERKTREKTGVKKKPSRKISVTR